MACWKECCGEPDITFFVTVTEQGKEGLGGCVLSLPWSAARPGGTAMVEGVRNGWSDGVYSQGAGKVKVPATQLASSCFSF